MNVAKNSLNVNVENFEEEIMWKNKKQISLLIILLFVFLLSGVSHGQLTMSGGLF